MYDKINIDLDFTIKEAFNFIKTTRGLSNKKIKAINNKLLDMLYKIEFCNSLIELEDKIIVGDACFLFKNSKDELLKEIEIVPGKYEYNINLLRNCINRPRNIVILLENEIYSNLDFQYIGNVFVGSGTLCVFNNSFYKEMNSLYAEDKDKFELKVEEILFSNENATAIDKQTIDNKYLISDTSYGDGWYAVFVKKNNEGKIIGIKIDFEADAEELLFESLNKKGEKRC